MKALVLHFDDKDFALLKDEKRSKTWHDFILERCLKRGDSK
jgi:hypothetical protein